MHPPSVKDQRAFANTAVALAKLDTALFGGIDKKLTKLVVKPRIAGMRDGFLLDRGINADPFEILGQKFESRPFFETI